MTAAVLDAPRTTRRAGGSARPAGGRRTTLAELLDGIWRSARADAEAECPLCHSTMHMDEGTARCDDCGTTLS
jgi:hypothetical protein